MICPVCGNDIFEYDTDNPDGVVTCKNCNKVFTRTELIEANKKRLQADYDDLKQDFLDDAKMEINKMLKKHFGSK